MCWDRTKRTTNANTRRQNVGELVTVYCSLFVGEDKPWVRPNYLYRTLSASTWVSRDSRLSCRRSGMGLPNIPFRLHLTSSHSPDVIRELPNRFQALKGKTVVLCVATLGPITYSILTPLERYNQRCNTDNYPVPFRQHTPRSTPHPRLAQTIF